jgi:hypothetical protein
VVGAQTAGAHEQEARQIDAQLRDLEIRLVEEYGRRGDGCAARVQRTLEAHRQRFANARVRTFLPILIERAARAELAAGPGC